MWNCTGPRPTSNSHSWLRRVAWALWLLCGNSWKDFLTQPVKRNTSSQATCAKWSSLSCQLGCRSCASEVNDFTSGWRNFWEEGWSNLNIPNAEETVKSLPYFVLNITMNPGSAKCTNWTNEWMIPFHRKTLKA